MLFSLLKFAKCSSTQSILRGFIIPTKHNRCVQAGAIARSYSMFEPDGLDDPPEIPEYPRLSIRMEGYDFVPLESFSKFVHNMASGMGVKAEAIMAPCSSTKITNYKLFSINVENTYDMDRYVRVVHVDKLQSTMAPLLFEVLQQNLPEGVDMTVSETTQEEIDFLYVPNLMLEDLKTEMQDLRNWK